MNYAGITEVLQLAPLFLPLLERLSPFYLSSTTLLFCPLLLALVLSIYIVQFSRCKPLILLQDQIEMLGRLPKHFNLFLVEVTGLEPVTPCLQSRCSTS